ncbi:unnamed protein product [Cylicocyclus nassatus]|uniref:Hexosyltransferase n=1 Tax=Cylicocyclus nassatus TaxID=53992 RepID=A0AA36MC97_CYLNA|nr:unnamed protein product [Cylicocyclus nassatus]
MTHRYSLATKVGCVLLLFYCLLLKISFLRDFHKTSIYNSSGHKVSLADFTPSYRYTMLPNLSLCHDSRENKPLMVVTVLSVASHSELRRAIRESWASAKNSDSIKTGHVVVFFILSSPSSIYEVYKVQKEQFKYNDLIVTDLPETYEDLFLKVYATLVFHQQYCHSARFLMKVDEDIAVHLDRMLESWTIDDQASSSLFCHLLRKTPRITDSHHKWYVPDSVWPEPYFPTYCMGGLYVMGKEAGQLILDYARIFPPLIIEDLFYTGIVAEIADVQRIDWRGNIIWKDFWRRKRLPCNGSEPVLFAVHSLPSPGQMRKGFRRLKDYDCTR